MLASCSTGQLTGELDVEGLCAELTASGARATLAPKWDVHAADSPSFLNVVLANYLRLCGEADSTVPKRAVALNQARRHFLSHSVPNNRSAYRGFLPSGINTVAAFELFGVG